MPPKILTSRGKGERLRIFGRWPAGTKSGTYFIVWNNGATLAILSRFIVPGDVAGTFAISEPLPAGNYLVGATAAGPGTIAVYNGRWNKSDLTPGTWSVSDFNPSLTATLNDTSYITPNSPGFAGAVS
jgi:hypothetical protein